jgi:hypothetical protein
MSENNNNNNNNNKSVEVEVRNWDGHSFTVEGVNYQLEKLLKEQKIIHTLALKHHGKMVRICRDVRLKSRKDFYFTPELDTAAIKSPLYSGTMMFEYEDLDNCL